MIGSPRTRVLEVLIRDDMSLDGARNQAPFSSVWVRSYSIR